jgi:hypothetical protein
VTRYRSPGVRGRLLTEAELAEIRAGWQAGRWLIKRDVATAYRVSSTQVQQALQGCERSAAIELKAKAERHQRFRHLASVR